jgi:hypothetical protein
MKINTILLKNIIIFGLIILLKNFCYGQTNQKEIKKIE